MLYCFSQSDYPLSTLENYFSFLFEQDCVVLWQDGVLLALKYPQLFTQVKCNCYVLEQDIAARHLQKLIKQFCPQVQSISMAKFVKLTEQYYPQLAL